ncbi:hypothetical protein [Thioclava sp. FTW29]|uniref:Uncharacterized protein n=1 Tax=Thioclava litoralis TaxID=3076557 RepID=A0ABZ1E3J7_9RHOB|nr:hypothetical protein RPE78_13710 [Thioclava sp. FTW29]
MALRTHIDRVSSQIIENFEAIEHRFLSAKLKDKKLMNVLLERLIASGSLCATFPAGTLFETQDERDCLYGLYDDIRHILCLRSRARTEPQSVTFKFRPVGVDIVIILDPQASDFVDGMTFVLRAAVDDFEDLTHVVHCDKGMTPRLFFDEA